MKKFLLTLVALCCTGLLPVAAQNYNEKLIVTINGESTDSIPASIIVEQREDGKINFVLKNFMLVAGEDVMPVGNISLEGVDVVQEEGYKAISTDQTITIQPGDTTDIPAESWIGPILGEVPILLNGKLNDTNLYCTIDIDMQAMLEQTINVVIGQDNGFEQLPNVVASQTYNEKLIVTINGESTDSIPASIIVEQREDGKINFVLKNFMLVAGEDVMPVGNISLEGVDVVQEEGYKAISTDQTITIQPGDTTDIPAESWIGPILGEVPILLNGKLNDTRLYCTIDINMMESLGQVINVVIGQPLATGIHSATVTDNATTRIFTLSGRRVPATSTDNLPKGVYIVNGKKVIR